MDPVTGLALGRVAVGGLSFARPDLAATAFQLDPAANPQLPYISRMFGSREVALGLATLVARGRTRRAVVAIGVAVDAADVATGYLVQREGSASRTSGTALAAVALGAVAVGLLDLVGGALRRG